jgi:hypothetical protein
MNAVILNEVKDPSIARMITLDRLRLTTSDCEIPRSARDEARKTIGSR